MRRKKQATTNPTPSTGRAYQERVEQLYADYPVNTIAEPGQEQHVEDADLGVLRRGV
jgi:hypothetical protein